MSKLKKIGRWLDDRSGFSDTILPLLRHPVPPGAKWSYVFGSATLFCLLLQVVTGVALSMMYLPSAEEAYSSLQFITHQAVLGNWLRGIHYFGASGMILMVGVHMVRVYITASYKYPREMSWISGVFLLIFTISMGFTGQLLRWDSNGVWSSVVAAEQLGRMPFVGTSLAHLLLGGDTLGGQSLSRFYSIHVFILPAMIFLFVGFHLQQVIRNGISEPTRAGRLVDPKTYRAWYERLLQRKGVPFWPDAAWRDAVFGSVVIFAILGLAYYYGPPELTQPPDPTIVHTTPKPDWYMLAIFALFALMPPEIESWVIFIGPILAITALIALPLLSNKGERSPRRRPWAVVLVVCVVVFMASLLKVGFSSPWSPKFETTPVAEVAPVPSDPVLAKGMHLFYDKGCQYCHQVQGQGGITGPNLSHIGRNWTTQQLQIQIVNGGDDMPAYGGMLKDDELHALVTYLKAQQ